MRTLVTGGSGFIGTNLVEALRQSGRKVLSIDTRPPRRAEHAASFQSMDVLDYPALLGLFEAFGPTEVVHLAAKTDFAGKDDYGGYMVNTLGTLNVITAIVHSVAVTRAIFASSNVVPADSGNAAEAIASKPRFRYEESKIAAERIIRTDTLIGCDWCIVRPCYVWGPWFGAPFKDFFLAIARRRYFHLGSANPPKLLGYVGNVVFEILKLLEARHDKIHAKTFYLSDYEPTTIAEWSELISRRLDLPAPRTLPEPLVRAAAWTGDMLKAIGYDNPPLTFTRLAHMRTDTTQITTIDAMKELTGRLPYSLERGVDETIRWLRERGEL